MLIVLFCLIILAVVNALYLMWQHRRYRLYQTGIVCPLNGHCEEVVESKFGKTLGFSNEILGLFYYLFLSLLIWAYFYPALFCPIQWCWIYLPSNNLMLGLPNLQIVVLKLIYLFALASFIFTTYLLIVQLLVLKKYCTWCLIAAVLNYLIIGAVLLIFVF